MSVIFPVYNEFQTVEKVLKDWDTYLATFGFPYHLIVCEDGSSDGTAELLRKLQRQLGFVLDHQAVRRGYGGAVLDGIRAANTSHILCVDSDGQCNPRDVAKFLPQVGMADVLIGWRQQRADAPQRLLFSWLFHTAFTLLFPTPIHDPSAPYVLFPKPVVAPYLSDLRYLKEGFWWGFVGMCVKRGVTLQEIVVDHRPRLDGDTQVYHLKKIPSIAIRNLIGLVRLKLAA